MYLKLICKNVKKKNKTEILYGDGYEKDRSTETDIGELCTEMRK